MFLSDAQCRKKSALSFAWLRTWRLPCVRSRKLWNIFVWAFVCMNTVFHGRNDAEEIIQQLGEERGAKAFGKNKIANTRMLWKNNSLRARKCCIHCPGPSDIDGKVHSSLQPAQSADKLGSFGANLRRAVGTSGPFVRLAAICCSTQTFVFFRHRTTQSLSLTKTPWR